MISPWRSLLLLTLHPSPPSLVKSVERGWLRWVDRGLVGVLVLLLLVLFNAPFYLGHRAFASLAHWDGVTLSQEGGTVGQLQQTVWALRQEAQGVDWRASALDLAEKQVAITGKQWGVNGLPPLSFNERPSIPVVLIGAEEPWSAWVRRGLEKEGFVLHEQPCARCVRLEWNSTGWTYRVPAAQVKATEAVRDRLKRTLAWAKRYGLEGIASERVRIPAEDLGADMKAVAWVWLDFCLHASFALLAWLLIWSSGYVGLSWDRSRGRGALEPWIMVGHPAWVLYGSRILRMAGFNALIFLVAMLTGWAWGLPLHWPLLLALWVALPVATLAVGLWGMLSTVLFHHRSGRLFSRLLFSPMVLLSAWFIRAMVVWMAICATDPPRAYDWAQAFLSSGAWWIGLSIPVLMGISWVLWRGVEWRIGSSGLGLRRSL